jgi:hypothetical protein
MQTHFSHPWSSGLEVLVALALGFWLGSQHTRFMPAVCDFMQALLGS